MDQPVEQPQVQIALNLTKEGLIITIPVGINELTMNEIVKQWLSSHPQLLSEVSKQVVHAKQQELAVIQKVKKSKV